MPYLLVVLGALVLGLAGLALVTRAPRELTAIRRIRRVPIGRLRTRTRCRIVGRVRALNLEMVAPLANVPCVYYRLRIHQRHGDACRQVVDIDDCVAFVVDDETGVLVVDPRGGVIMMTDHQRHIRLPHEQQPRERALLARFGLPADGTYELAETVVRVGGRVAVVGTPARDGHRTMCVKLAKRHDAELFVTDHRSALA